MKLPIFKLSVLSLALFGNMAHAAGEHTQELQNIVVKGDPSSSARRITVKRMEESTNTQLKEVLKNEPSISMGAGSGTSQYLYLRGMGQNSIDVKVDNAYSDSQIHYHQGRHMLDPALVKIVAVQKGAGSASAGIGQTNGAIIAKTLDAADLLKNSSNPNFGARINAGYNSNDGHNYGLAVFGQNGAFDYLLAGNHVQDNNYKGGKGYVNSFGENKAPYSELNKNSYLAKLGATFGNQRFVLSHMHEQHKGERLVREEFPADPIGTPGSKLTLDRQFPAERKMYVDKTDLTWAGKDLGFAQSAEANVYHMTHGRWSADDSGNGYAGGKRNTSSTKNKVITTGANVNFDTQIHDKILLKYGANYRQQEVKPNTFFNAKLNNQEKRDMGVYVEAISDVTDKLTLTTGLRYDHFNFKAMDGKKRSDGAVNPSVSAIYQVTPEFSVNALHNYATRSPRMHDVLLSHGARGVITIGDNTKAEQARNTEIGFNFNNGTFGLEGAYFWQNIKDALGTTNGRSNHGTDAQAIVNAGKIKNHGYELSGSYRNGAWTARLGVAHSKPCFHSQTRWEKDDSGKMVEKSLLSGNPEYASAIGRTWTASLAYRFANPNLELGTQLRVLEKVKAEDNYFIQGGTLKTGSDKGKAGYGVVDVSANWKPLNNDKMNVNFAVHNVANKNYRPHAQRGAFAGEGRQFRVGMNYTF
ncbi:TonB-dependent receptor [Wielerella bovis]|uniref:TonB-dependent receptor domain-containing protein n=1 Tax=Wielerella bovis TaxID=2917790 RepID=UPI0020186A52|nr:TonB-dependent receptor [Wielerella bovis]ULJ62355.1 TonB-dependent receptor [Wielerella bovis]